MQQLIEEHDEMMNYVQDNGTTDTIEELEKLRQILEEKKVMLWKVLRIHQLRLCNRVLIKIGKRKKKNPKP